MRPVLCTIGGRPVASYPAMLYLGLVAGVVAGNVAANAAGLHSAKVYAATLVLLLPALAGARLASTAGRRPEPGGPGVPGGPGGPGGVWRRSRGGQAMYGGLVAVPLSVPLLAALGVPFHPFWDAATFTILVGMVFARAGCLLTGCCAGRPTASRFGVVLPDAAGVVARRVPTQAMEAAVAVALLGAAVAVAGSALPDGAVFAAVLAGYSLARLVLQPLRARQRRVAGLPALSAASAALLAAALAWMLPTVA